MSRSYKKAIITISKAWDKFKEKQFRRKTKKELANIEKDINFDPDRDFEESLDYSKMGDYGTKICYEFWDLKEGVDNEDELRENEKHRDELRRK